jgi:hypothetical protein
MDSNYFQDYTYAQKLGWILGLPHFHHHEKRGVTKTASSVSLSKQGLHPSPSFVMNNLTRRGLLINFLLYFIIFLFNPDDECDVSGSGPLNKSSNSRDIFPTDREETISMTPSISKVK